MAKKKYFSEDDLTEIRRQSIAFIDASTQKMAAFFERVNDYDRLYHVKLPKDLQSIFEKHPDRSAMVPPDIYNNISSVRAQLTELLFSQKPYAIVSHAGRPNQRDEIIDKAESKLSALIDISGFLEECDKINHQTLIGGISCCMTEWHIEYRRKIKRDPDTNLPEMKNGEFVFDTVEVARYPRAKGIDIRRVRIDDKAESKSDIRLVGYHARWNISDLINEKNNPDSPIDFDEDKLKRSSFPHAKYYEYVAEEKPLQNKPSKVNYGDEPVEIFEIRGIYKLKNKYRDLIVKLANRDIVIEARPNDLPIAGWEVFDFSGIDSEFNKIFTMGLVEPAEDVFIESFLKRNQSLDAANRQTYDMYLSDASAGAELPDQIEYVGGGILKVNLLGSGATSVSHVFQPLPKFANPIDTFQQSEALKNDTQETMKRNDYAQGSDPARKETATAVGALSAAAYRDIKRLVGLLAQSYIIPVWKKYLLYQSFFEGHKTEEITTPDGKNLQIAPGELDGPFNITIDISAQLDRPTARRTVVEMMPFLQGNPLVNQYYLLKTALWYLQYPNIDKIVPPPDKLIADIERENLALSAGIPVPVHPQDDHIFHLEIHMKRAEEHAQNPKTPMSPQAIMAYEYHVTEHQKYIKQVNNPAGVNTPNQTSGLNEGQMTAGMGAGLPGQRTASAVPG